MKRPTLWLGITLRFSLVFFLAAASALAQSSGVLREVYTGIPGIAVSDLTSSPNFPGNPTTVEALSSFEAPIDVDNYYGQRLTAYLVAPTSGDYTFWVASDDNSVLYLSTDSSPANKREIASVPEWTASRQWEKFPNQVSAPIWLTAGQRYYIEALMKEHDGGDNLAVRWQLPGGAIEEPIPASRLQVYGLTPPEIIQQPSNVTVPEGGSATFTVQLAWSYGATYQWKRGAANISGATSSSYTLTPVTLGDNGAQFRCAITNGQGSSNSAFATLTVQADTTPPTILSVGNLGDNTLLMVLFSEPVESSSGGNRLNYTINNGINVSSATLSADFRTVTLVTSAMSPGVNYTLTVNNVRDRATNPNTIATNTQRVFNIDYTPLDIAALTPAREPIGQSSRRSGLTISEIMYHPTNRPDQKILEFIEIYNSQVYPEDLSGWRLSGDVEYTFPANTTLNGGSYLVVAPVPADVQSAYGISGVLGGFTNRLANSGGTVRLRNRQNAIMVEANFSDNTPWPVAADGAGHSLVLARPTYGEGNVEAWEASDRVGGSPGAAEGTAANPYRTIRINEYLAHTDLPEVDYIELYNYSSSPVNLAGCVLTDDPTTNRYVIPSGTIPARGWVHYTQTTLGFALNAAGETLYLKNPSGTMVLDAVKFGGQQNGVATGRYPDGAPNFFRLVNKTPGTANGRALVSDIVLNEIMYNPISGNSDDEFVEIHNRGASAVNLGGWQLDDAVSFVFPANAVIPAGGYVIVGNNASRLLTNYAGLNSNNTFGNYGGKLSNGERLALTMPDEVVSTNGSVLVTNIIAITVDDVSFKRGGRWGKWADKGGSSLELVDARSDHRQAPNWADSDESSKSAWVNIEYTGVLDNGSGNADSLNIVLQGAGECLVDNVEVFISGGGNLVANSTFESNFDGWYVQGTHDYSYWQTSGGYGGGRCLHIVASGRGDTGANRIRTPLTSMLSPGQTATLRAKVKWLKGNPEVLLRLHGNYLEAYGNVLAANNLGTPGAVNSRRLANTGPAIHDVSHSPILPAGNEAVVVRAQVNDPDGLASLVLKYRVDPSTNFSTATMVYNGAGIYSGTIPGQAAGALVAFHIQAADGSAASSRFPTDAPVRECLVRFGEPNPSTGRVQSYHLLFTQATNNRWTSRERNSNEPLDATFVYGNYRVVYNAGTLYSGSPFHTPGFNGPMGNICDYIIIFPEDDLMLGTTDFVVATLGNNSDETGQREQAAFWIMGQMGVPTLYRRPVNMFVNGLQRGTIYEDAQQPSGDFVDQWFSDDPDGELHKIEDWFEFVDSGDTMLFNVDATLENFTTTDGAKKLARYRWNWRKRAVKFSANDYSELYKLVDAVNAAQPEPYNTQVDRLVDYEKWARVMAIEHIAGNWDSYGYRRGKNMYAYKPKDGKWTLIPWDIDFVFDMGGDAASTDLNPASMSITDGTMRTFLTFAPIQRAWWRALQDALNGPLADANISAMMYAKYNGLLAAGIPVSDPSGPLSYIAARRSQIQTLLAGVSYPFGVSTGSYSTNRNYVTLTGTAPIGVSDISINGVIFPVTWTSVSTWRVTVALNAGANVLTVRGLDPAGNQVGGSTSTFTITYTGTAEQPQDRLVINEIMYNPALPNASFVEIHNTSTTFAFDLSGYRLNGTDFVFPGGTIIMTNGFLVVAGDGDGFTAAYGTSIPLAGVFAGALQNDGETLQLIKPGATPAQDVIVDEVTYASTPPWPTDANGFGPSLQLIDPFQDNARVANWAVATTNSPPPTPQWQYVTVTGTVSNSRLYIYLDRAGDVYIDDIKLVAGSVPEVGQNLMVNGDFETPLSGTWYTTPNTANSSISSTIKHSGNGSLRLVCNAQGSTSTDCLLQTNNSVILGNQYTLSFWFLQQPNAGTLTVRYSSSTVRVDQNIQAPSPVNLQPATPGATNSVRATLGAFPLVWLNEIQPNNLTGPRDNANDRDPWVELYNSGATTVTLANYYLTDTFSNLVKWPFPAGASINSGQFCLVWLDNEPAENSGTNFHANFRAPTTNGLVILTRVMGTTTNVVDYLKYSIVNNDRSYGAYPDGAPAKRRVFYYATPYAPNNNSWPAVPVLVNEWMADNSHTIVNRAEGKWSDWFELYNSGPSTVDLSGYYLGTTLTSSNQFEIPAGYTIPSGGFLLVWADSTSGNNSASDPALHTNFKLSANGESIALFTPAGALIEGVTFGLQTNDISQGRFPDGNSGQYYFMTNATPGAPNMLAQAVNHAPVLTAVPDQSVYQGSPLTFTASAMDVDLGQTLTYSLDPGSPGTAFINPSSGVFTWTPTQADPPGIYFAYLRVTDNGLPQGNDTGTARITVLTPPPLTITSIDLGEAGGLTITWATQPQRTYRVLYKTNLDQPTWSTLTELTAAGTQLWTADDTGGASRRFYRIELLPY